jgi:23S rRNA pseudouridine2605 synthase
MSKDAPTTEGGDQRLQKIISTAGVASRRLAEELITQGRVEVNGKTVTTLGTKANLERDEIKVDGRRIKAQKRKRYILLYKPRGYVTTRSDPEGRATVMDLLKGVKEYVYPVGRLDYDSEGLLLLMNDGDLAARLMHPRHEIEKVYEARVRGVPAPEDLERLARGIVLDGKRTAPAKIRVPDRPTKKTESGAEHTFIEIVLHEGRQRQVRRMFESIGHPVVRLRRVRIGPITDENIPIGHWRELDEGELTKLRRAAKLPPTADGSYTKVTKNTKATKKQETRRPW